MPKNTNKKNREQIRLPSFDPLEVQDLITQDTMKKPDYLTRLIGVFLIFIATVGLFFTSPLMLTFGCIGFIGGLIFENPWSAGYTGARIGALGTIDLALYGFALAKAMTDIISPGVSKEKTNQDVIQLDTQQEEQGNKVEDLIKPSTSIRISTAPDSLFKKTKVKRGESKAEKINELERSYKDFLNEIEQYIEKAQAEIDPEKSLSNERHVKDPYIEKLISITQDTLDESSFWERLEQMSSKDIQIYIERLGSNQELNNLWLRFRGVEFEPSAQERKRNKFAQMLEALSQKQLEAAFKSPDFLSILSKSFYVEAAANTLNRTQLALFAADPKNGQLLNSLIEKFKPSPCLLGKLISIMPYATETVRSALLIQISHLPYPVTVINKLDKLAQGYIKINHEEKLAQFKGSNHSAPPHKTSSSKWRTIITVTKPIYAAPVKKEDLSDHDFETFIQHLNSPNYYVYQQSITDILSTLPNNRIKILVERVSLPEFQTLLTHLWDMEAKTLNQKSLRDSRENRLKVILMNLSEPQLKNALHDSKFWEIFKNPQESFGKMAANVVTPQQFVTIIANSPLERHEDFASILIQINKDSEEERRRLRNVIEAILPYTTPWLALALELQIKSILVYNKTVYEQLNHKLKENLSRSLQNSEISLKYTHDLRLDKKAISQLIIDLDEPLDLLPRVPLFG